MDDPNAGKEFSRDPTVDDLIKLCEKLNEAEVEYVIIGGFALIHYGFLRGTGNIDLLVNPKRENIERIKEALLYLSDKAAKHLNLTDISKYQVVRVADEIVIDLIGKACDITFEKAKKHIVYEKINDVRIPYLDIPTLIETKKTIRPRDHGDREFLEELLQMLKRRS